MNLGIEPPKGVLLFGPPGTGKTLCARAVANRTDACFIRVIGSELVQKYVGEVRASTWWSVEEFAHFPCGYQTPQWGQGMVVLENCRCRGAGAVRSLQVRQWWQDLRSAVTGEGDFAAQSIICGSGGLELGFCSQLCHLFFSWPWGKLLHLYFWV